MIHKQHPDPDSSVKIQNPRMYLKYFNIYFHVFLDFCFLVFQLYCNIVDIFYCVIFFFFLLLTAAPVVYGGFRPGVKSEL